jgi:hypothetical protein
MSNSEGGGMIVLICGDRHWTNEEAIENYILSLPSDSTIIHGACRGADTIAHKMALKHGLKVYEFPAEWGLHGFAAGPIRNRKMLEQGDPEVVVAFHDNLEKSKGTKDMIRQAENAGVPVIVRTLHRNPEVWIVGQFF